MLLADSEVAVAVVTSAGLVIVAVIGALSAWFTRRTVRGTDAKLDQVAGDNATQHGQTATALHALTSTIHRSHRANQAEHRWLAESLPVPMWRANGGGFVTWSNGAWRQATGQDQTAAHGAGWLDAIDPSDRTLVAELWEAAVAAGAPLAPVRCTLRAGDCSIEARPVEHPDGSIEYVGTVTLLG